MFDADAEVPSERPIEKLAPPPRKVPAKLAILNLARARDIHLIPMYAYIIAVARLRHSAPQLIGTIGILLAVAVVIEEGLEASKRLRLLRRGKVAKTEGLFCNQRGIFFKRSRIFTMRGWDVELVRHSGPDYKNRIRYVTDEGYRGEITHYGAPYEDGVILYDPEAPTVARPVDKFNGHPKPGDDGQWTARLDARNILAAALFLVTVGVTFFLALSELMQS